MASELLIKTTKASELLQISERALWTMMKSGEIPHVRIGRCVRYSPVELREWVEKNKTVSTGMERANEMSENGDEVVASKEETVKSLHLFGDFSWTKRARTAFHKCNIHTLEQLLAMNPGRLLKVENVGRTTLREIQQKLTVRGLSLKLSKSMVSGASGWTEERRQKTAINRGGAVERGREGRWKKAKQSPGSLEDFDKAVEGGAVAAAQLLLECCSPEVAKRMIDLVSAIGRETSG